MYEYGQKYYKTVEHIIVIVPHTTVLQMLPPPGGQKRIFHIPKTIKWYYTERQKRDGKLQIFIKI